MDFEQSFTRLLGHEGGYSNRRLADDPGGATMWGITIATARANGYTGDMRDLSQEVARAIYRRQYWDAIKADALPEALRYPMFDAAVNSGPGQAAKWLQRSVGVFEDGAIGPITIKACGAIPAGIIAARLAGHRLMFMTSLPNWVGNARGWSKRIAQTLMEA